MIDVLNSILLKKRFCKDCNVPISVFDNPYFMERIEYLDTIMPGLLDRFNDFCMFVDSFNSTQEYFEYYNYIKESLIDDIKSNKHFIEFNTSNDFSRLHLRDKEFTEKFVKYPKRNVYINDNCGTDADHYEFISIDMKKANFSALNLYNRKIFNANSWEDYISRFTHSKHIINSKYIRQVVMGACNPGKQIKLEEAIMKTICMNIFDVFKKNNVNENIIDLYSINSDEIVLKFTPKNGVLFLDEYNVTYTDIINLIFEALKNTTLGDCSSICDILKVTGFSIRNLNNYGYVRYDTIYSLEDDLIAVNYDTKFKCIDSEIYIQVLKSFYGKEITEDDLIFYHNGRLATFLEPISFNYCDEA